MNPLLKDFKTSYNTAPFKQISTEDFLPAFQNAIQEGRNNIDSIIANPEKANFENTIEALEFSTLKLDRISSLFFNLNAAETSPQIQALAQEISPMLTAFSNDVALNTKLFLRIKKVYDQKNQWTLTKEQLQLLDKKYKSFVRNGANLNNEDKTKLRAIDEELSRLKLTFGEHLLAETNKFRLHIDKKKDLSGLPENVIETAKNLAEKEKKKGWLFTLDYPSYVPFMTYCENRSLRKKMAIAYGKRGFQDDSNDNQDLVLKITNLRHLRANLLGYKTHAHYILEERMAKTPEKVLSFLNDFKAKAKPAALREFGVLENYAKDIDNIDRLQKWDSAYYAEKLKKELFDFDDELLKPYFELSNVLKGAFAVAQKLFGLKFEVTNNIDPYHPEVETYTVSDSKNNLVAIFYADFFPRAGKRSGAWMTSFKPQYIRHGINERPHVSIVCNFTKPTKTQPALLTFNEVTTLFHEFGHALHGMLANTTYPSLSGTNVAWDFVELPSQLMENWCYEEQALKLFAKHYQTHEILPMKWINKLKALGQFQQGMQTLRQLSFGFLDMAWHTSLPESFSDVKTLEKEAFKDTNLFPEIQENCMSTSFAHIFQGGYSAGYYSYKWAEVLEADAFAYFKTRSIFDQEIAQQLKTYILSQGGTEDAEVLYKRFRGKAASNKALLEKSGLI